MSDAPFRPLDDLAALDDALAHSETTPVVFYKHSSTCFVSYRARRRMLELTAAGDPPVYEVVVQKARPVSNAIAERLGVRHESPQVIVVWHGRPVFDASHGAVNAEVVRQQAAEAQVA